jgi:hypothetical protein
VCVAQFKDMSTQVVMAPAEYESGKVIYPYEKAKQDTGSGFCRPHAEECPLARLEA